MLISAIVIMTMALLFYSIGVWGEKLGGGLKPWLIWLVPYITGILINT